MSFCPHFVLFWLDEQYDNTYIVNGFEYGILGGKCHKQVKQG